MTIIAADYIVLCDENKGIIQNGALVFDTKIHAVNTLEAITKQYPNHPIQHLPKNSIIIPGLINPHIHFEFSANINTLSYGSFLSWLYSVIEHRENLVYMADTQKITALLDTLLACGTTTIGAISSYGFDLEALSQARQHIVFFPELLGSRPDMIDALYRDFCNRQEEAQTKCKKNFEIGLAIHSPYSTHPLLIKKALTQAKNNHQVVQAHFLESLEEKEWLENNSGPFQDFFKNFLQQTTALTKPDLFLEQFDGIKNLSFTHCTQANEHTFKKIKQLGANIITCPVSNRLLTNSALNLAKTQGINLALATDGLSSNTTLNLFDEMRAGLYIHATKNLNELSTNLLYYATAGGAQALGLKKGSLIKDFDADFLVIELEQPSIQDDLVTNIILHTHKPKTIYLQGVQVGAH